MPETPKWTPSIPETPATEDALAAFQTVIDGMARESSNLARRGDYENATTLAILSDVLQAYLDDGHLDDDFDEECEKRFERSLRARAR